jgi:hypothetical protein
VTLLLVVVVVVVVLVLVVVVVVVLVVVVVSPFLQGKTAKILECLNIIHIPCIIHIIPTKVLTINKHTLYELC